MQHVGVARAYLNRSKFSAATKARIASCITGKAKSLGCNSGKDKKAKSHIEYSYEALGAEEKVIFDSEIFKETKELVEQSISNPGMELSFKECKCE